MGCRLQDGKVLWGKEKIRMFEHIPIPGNKEKNVSRFIKRISGIKVH
jgi:hypothetical protein